MTEDLEPADWRRQAASAEQLRIDVIGAVGFALLGVLSIVLTRAIGWYGEDAAAPPVSVALILIITLALAWRRRYPSAVAITVAIAFIVSGELIVEEEIIRNIALFCAIYTVGAWEPDRRRALWVRIGTITVMGIWLLVSMFRIATLDLGTDGPGVGALTPNVGFMLQNLLINVLYFAGAYWFGEQAWQSARQRAMLQRRTEQLAVEQARLAQQAVTIERLRIARELHDAVAHHVSLMGVQAAAARTILPRDTEGAQQQLAVLEDSARSAVSELYALLGTLRVDETPPEDRAEPAAATLGLSDIPRLAAEADAAGLEVSTTQVGDAVTVSPLVGLNLYRIAQEALTNVVKHAGSGTRTVVTVRYLPDAVELEIADDGRKRPSPSGDGNGLGLPGMRERVASLNGTLTVGPRSSGGFIVRARVPVTAAPSDTTHLSGETVRSS